MTTATNLAKKSSNSSLIRVTEEESLFSQHPLLMNEWDYKKNIDLNPKQLASKSHKRAWWICSKNPEHTWDSIISSRTIGRGCPYCSGRRVTKESSLAYKNPTLSKEWHPTKNGKLTPETVAAHSHKKAWWLCKDCNEPWKAMISNRMKGRGCPACVSWKHTSFPEQTFLYYLQKAFPDIQNRFLYKKGKESFEIDLYIPSLPLAIEYDGYHHKQKRSIVRDTKKNKFLKENNIPLIRVRIQDLSPLPYEYGKTFIHKPYDEYDYHSLRSCLQHTIAYITESYQVNETQLQLLQQVSQSNILEDKKTILASYLKDMKEKSIAYTHSHLVAEWHPTKNGELLPIHFSKGAKIGIHWICKKNHEWTASIDNRANKKSGCPTCSPEKAKQKTLPTLRKKYGSLAERHPYIASLWHPTKNGDLTPNDVFKSTKRFVWWQCEEDHEFETSPANMMNRKQFLCQICKKEHD